MKRPGPDVEDKGGPFMQSMLLYRRRQVHPDSRQQQGAHGARMEDQLPMGCHEDIGKREYMEDRHVSAELCLPSSFPLGRTLLLAVFDGHGGDIVADFLRSNASTFITRELVEHNGKDVAAALQCAFLALDAEVTASFVRSGPLMEMGGSTALVVLCAADHIVCANAGDSRGVLARGGHETVPLSHDHKPDRQDELARIQQAGGCVLHRNGGPRVMGVLAMTRAIGDKMLQQYGLTPVPEVHVITRSTQDEFLILASDGLWGVMSNEEAVDITRRCLQRAASKGANAAASARIAAKVLSRTAFSRGNCDNITVMVVDLQNLKQGYEPGQQASSRQQAAEEPSALLSLDSFHHESPGPAIPAAPITPLPANSHPSAMQRACLP